jgi:hypothetical protein
MGDVHFIWDLEDNPQGNYWHIVKENGVSQEEFEEVWLSELSSTAASRSSGRPITFGWTRADRYIAIVWEHVQDDPVTVYPVTAYDVEPPAKD